jgi:tRNA-uridine 2-sulfurtransferase
MKTTTTNNNNNNNTNANASNDASNTKKKLGNTDKKELVDNNNTDINNKKQKQQQPTKAVALLSGGLDSNLSIRMMQEQGVEVEAIAVKTPFCDFDCGKGCGHRVQEVALELGIKLKTVYFGEDYLKMLKNPKYGYGSGMNPCIDCRSMMYSAAKEHMEKIGADFIITGEVLGQRPMSQNGNALKIIENETETNGKIVRPLSLRHLPITEAENKGLIKREKMGDIKGRSRRSQLQLAKKFDISDPPNAAGGCLLTDPAFSIRIKDLYHHTKEGIPDLNDIELLKIGRHFRLSDNTKLIVGRNKMENEILESLTLDDDIIIEVSNYVGPTCLLRTKRQILSSSSSSLSPSPSPSSLQSAKEIEIAASTALRYSDSPKDKLSNVKIKYASSNDEKEIQVFPIDNKVLDKLRI